MRKAGAATPAPPFVPALSRSRCDLQGGSECGRARHDLRAVYIRRDSLQLGADVLHGVRAQRQTQLGAPWIFGTDDPGALLPGWQANVTEPAFVGNALKRWPFPVAPPDFPGIPRGYLIEAVKT